VTRNETTSAIRHATGKKTDIEIMNVLQDRGLVSDTVVHLCDVPTCDLQAALEKLKK